MFTITTFEFKNGLYFILVVHLDILLTIVTYTTLVTLLLGTVAKSHVHPSKIHLHISTLYSKYISTLYSKIIENVLKFFFK